MSTTASLKPPAVSQVNRWERMIGGTALGLLAALCYTLANVCLRRAAGCDPIWVSCVKAMPTLAATLPYVVWRFARRQTTWASRRELLLIIGASCVAQLLGNVLFQWALGVVGLAMAVPLTLSSVIVGSAILGRGFLGEPITPRTLLSIGIVLVAIGVLSLGAPAAQRSVRESLAMAQASAGGGSVVLGVLALCVAGFAYSSLSATIRWASGRGTPLPGILFVTSSVGVVGLGTMVLAVSGPRPILETTPVDAWVMAWAGIFNAMAFFSLTLAMHWSGLLYVNLLNGSQAAMAAVIGVLFFNEALTWPLCLGVAMTVLGLSVLQRRRSPKPGPPRQEPPGDRPIPGPGPAVPTGRPGPS